MRKRHSHWRLIFLTICLLLFFILCLNSFLDYRKNSKPSSTAPKNKPHLLLPALKPVGSEEEGDGSNLAYQKNERWNASIEFTVLDIELDRPVQGVKIWLEGPVSRAPQYSDMDGKAEFLALPPGMYNYGVVHDISSPLEQKNAMISLRENAREYLLIEMIQSCLATGVILDARSSMPIVGARVYPHRYEDNEPDITDEKGQFFVYTGMKERAEVHIRAEGYAPQIAVGTCTQNKIDLGERLLTPSWALRGKVVDIQDRPLFGVTVQDYPEHEVRPTPNGIVRAISDENGEFKLEGLPTTQERIYFYKEGYGSKSIVVSAATLSGFTVKMAPACTLRGYVVQKEGKGIEGVFLTSITDDVRQSSRTMSATDGGFVFTDLVPGPLDVWVEFYQPTGDLKNQFPTECSLDNDKPITISLDLEKKILASGEVLDEDDSLVEGALVSALTETGSGPKIPISVMTNDEGHFEISVPEQGPYLLQAFLPKTEQRGQVKGLEGPQSRVLIRLKPQIVFEELPAKGRVVESDGTPVMNYKYCWSKCEIRRSPNSDGTWFRHTDYPQDVPPLWVFLPDHRLGTWWAGTKDQETEVKIEEGASITGKLGNSFGYGKTKLELSRRWLLLEFYIQDEFTLPLVPPGEYSLILTAPDGGLKEFWNLQVKDDVPIDLGVIEVAGQQ